MLSGLHILDDLLFRRKVCAAVAITLAPILCHAESSSTAVLDIPVITPVISSVVTNPTSPIITDGLFMTTVAELDYFRSEAAFGDTDHDGLQEVIFRRRDPVTFVPSHRIFEVDTNNVYTLVQDGLDLEIYATGDLDNDGKSEIIGQLGSEIYVLEAVDAASHPDQVVWISPSLSNVVGNSVVGDTDRDGRMEIIHSINSFGLSGTLTIFENVGDDSFDQVYTSQIIGSVGEKQVVDLDGDGLMEIVFITIPGWVTVIESSADNTWDIVWTDSTGMYNAGATEAGLDTDGNGKPELFVMGQTADACWTTYVYETTGDNAYAPVETLSVDCGISTGLTYNALGNIDGTGLAEYVMNAPTGLWIYRATSVGEWDVVGFYPAPGVVFTHDLNLNGKSELLSSRSPTLVLESAVVSDVGVGLGPRYAKLSVFPNPCRNGAALAIRGLLPASGQLSVYNIAGRLVQRLSTGQSGERFVWPADDLPVGVYLLRLESTAGTPIATGRATIVR